MLCTGFTLLAPLLTIRGWNRRERASSPSGNNLLPGRNLSGRAKKPATERHVAQGRP